MSVVDLLELKEGDEIEIGIAGDRRFDVSRDKSQEEALARLRALQRPLPPGFRFRREDVYER